MTQAKKFQIPIPIKLAVIIFTGFLFMKGLGMLTSGNIFKGMVFPPTARRSDNVEDKRADNNPTIDPSPEITIPPSTNTPEKPYNESNPVPSPTPSISPYPVPSDRTEADQTIPVGLPVGVISGYTPDYDGWNIRSCPSMSQSCVNMNHIVYASERVNVYLNERRYNDGVAWIKVYSPRLNSSGWIAASGVTVY